MGEAYSMNGEVEKRVWVTRGNAVDQEDKYTGGWII